MDPPSEKEAFSKEDSDSGLDNTSDSGQSCDEDQLAVSSDYEEYLNSDNEGNFDKNEDEKKLKLLNDDYELKSFSFSTNFGRINDSDFASNLSNVSKEHLSDSFIKHHLETNYIKKFGTLDNNDKKVIDFYIKLIKSQTETIDFSITSKAKKPDWLDEEKFKRGQKFARDYAVCVTFSEMLSLYILFAQKGSLGPLVSTGKSDCPYSAFVRYLDTTTKLMSWYQDDIWSEKESLGKTNLAIVRGMHKNVHRNLTNDIDWKKKIVLGDPEKTALWCTSRETLLEDFRECLPRPDDIVQEYVQSIKKVWINQTDMSLTQFGFVGLIVTYPEYFGLGPESEEDLEAFLHVWRGIGYLLGIKDEHNFCNGDLETVRKRTKVFLELIAKPAFTEVTCDWEHMSRCMVSGISFYVPSFSFEASFLYLCDMLQIETPRFRKKLSLSHYIKYQIHRLTFYLIRYWGILSWFNNKLNKIIANTQKLPESILEKWKSKEFTYMKQPGKCPITGRF